MDARAALKEKLDQNTERHLRLLTDVVKIPSENPPGDTTKVCDYFCEVLEKTRIPFRLVAPQKTMPNVVATIQGKGPGPHLVFNGHMDVFPAGDPKRWDRPPFSGAVADGKIWGRGVSDMKAGTTASFIAFLALAEIQDRWAGKMTLTLVSDEETFGQWGARYLIEHEPDVLGDCVLNGEPSTPGVVRFGEKGLMWFEVRVRTKGGHGGYAHMSPNAVKIAGKIIADMEELGKITFPMSAEVRERIERARAGLDKYLGAGATDTLYKVTVNIGTIGGGLKVNMIAADCTVEVDVRCPIGGNTDVLLEQAEEIVKRYPEASLHLIYRTEPNSCDPDHVMLGYVRQSARDVRSEEPLEGISLGGTDCRLWRLRGTPAIVYGPTPYNMGAPNEYVTVDDYLGTVKVHARAAYDYLTGGKK